MIRDFITALGLNPEIVFAGAAGGVLRALSRHSLRFREVVLAPICGLLAASYLTPIVVHYMERVGFPIPDDPMPAYLAAGFIVGTNAMWISDLIFKVIANKIHPSK